MQINKAKPEHILIFEKFMAKHESRKPNFEELLKWEQNRIVNYLEVSLIIHDNNSIVGYGRCKELRLKKQANTFQINLVIDPDKLLNAYGLMLYKALFNWAIEQHAIFIRVVTTESLISGSAFVNKIGNYKEIKRRFKQILELNKFKTSFSIKQIQDFFYCNKMRIIRLSDVNKEDYNIFIKNYYHLYIKTIKDETGIFGERKVLSFLEWQQTIINKEWFFFIIKIKEPLTPIATSNLLVSDKHTIRTGFTGIQREFRGKSLIKFLKQHTTLQAKLANLKYIITENDSKNKPILVINKKLGFKPKPAWITWESKIN